MGMGLGNIFRLSNAETRSINAENVYGEKGRACMAEITTTPPPDVERIGQTWFTDKDIAEHAARDLGRGWKVRIHPIFPAGTTTTIMDVDGPGCIQHLFLTFSQEPVFMRDLILRMYWDNEETPSVESPIADFFCNGLGIQTPILSLPINVNPTRAMNCYFPMPFGKHARITIENRNPVKDEEIVYNITYAITEVTDEDARFHAQFRRTNPLPYKEVYTILDGVHGQGHYVGTSLAWQQNNNGWWGEGETKFFLDGDGEFPTIVATGTEDYIGGAWGFGENFSAPFLGYPVGTSFGKAGDRHLMYRFHIMDPIRFKQDLKLTVQGLGWHSEGRYLPLRDDISSVAYWYQSEPHGAFPVLPDRDYLEVI